MRLGLSAEKENHVYSSGFVSLILALNQVMLKVLAGSFTEGAFTARKWKLDTPAEILVFDVSREHQLDEFKGKRYSVMFHQVTLTSLTHGLKRTLNSLRFLVVAAQSKNECSLRFLYLFVGTWRKPSIKDFLEKEIGGPFAFSESFQMSWTCCKQPKTAQWIQSYR